MRDERHTSGIEPSEPLVSVVIPAYNAASTLESTLHSVLSQTHRNLEVIIVDDGSRDATSEIAARAASADPRIELVQQPNSGVAEARNNGWRRARSDLIAFVDADDTWTPDKIARQLAVLQEGGPGMGLVYSWYAMIDADDRVSWIGLGPRHNGEVFDILLTDNFVGNGSSALVRRAALEAVRGFEPALHRAGAQGCEDILFYLRVAALYKFGVVEDYQIGYRQLPGAMSSNLPRMFRSWMITLDEMRRDHPSKRALIHKGLVGYGRWVTRRAIHKGRWRDVFRLAALAAKASPVLALNMILKIAPEAAWEMLRWRLVPARPSGDVAQNGSGPSLPYAPGDPFPAIA